jgi:hypothetical protein
MPTTVFGHQFIVILYPEKETFPISMSQLTTSRSSSYSLPTHLSVKVLGKYTLLSVGTPSQTSRPSNKIVAETRSFFNPERLRYMAEQNSELIYTGIVLLVAPILFIYFSIKDHILYDGKTLLIECLIAGGIAIRLAALTWIAQLSAGEKKWLQDQFLLAFFLPALALLVTGFTLGEPIRYVELVSDVESVEEEDTATPEVAVVAEAQAATLSERIPPLPYALPALPDQLEAERRRQAMEEAELARIAS